MAIYLLLDLCIIMYVIFICIYIYINTNMHVAWERERDRVAISLCLLREVLCRESDLMLWQLQASHIPFLVAITWVTCSERTPNTLPETNSNLTPENRPHKETIVFQPSMVYLWTLPTSHRGSRSSHIHNSFGRLDSLKLNANWVHQ